MAKVFSGIPVIFDEDMFTPAEADQIKLLFDNASRKIKGIYANQRKDTKALKIYVTTKDLG